MDGVHGYFAKNCRLNEANGVQFLNSFAIFVKTDEPVNASETVMFITEFCSF